ncbi:leucine-rich repeat protein [Clostridium transplantifaecale]|uniref:leucine-rich repeat protein n=1 Tax=Clostridium transplantifaecale TaxID=2479838 RepID=UPI0013DD97D8|nr:leucine-rich repeat protein [Clostridium transplantifaecale]
MKRKRRLAWLLTAAMLTGLLPTAVFAKEETLCENHRKHTSECGYVEGRPCGHRLHTEACYTDELICTETDKPATGSNAASDHDHTRECYALDCPHERGEHNGDYAEPQPCSHVCDSCFPEDSEHPSEDPDLTIEAATDSNASFRFPARDDVISENGFQFDSSRKELTISSDDGTTAWKNTSGISGTMIKSVVLEKSVTVIKESAFEGCANLETVDWSEADRLNEIEPCAFQNCGSLTLTKLPDGVTSIGEKAFSGCKNLALTSLPGNVTYIGKEAFSGCTNLALTKLPEGLTSIGEETFRGCTNLALTSLPGSVDRIGNSAFSGCANLKLTGLPNGVTTIGTKAFSDCGNLALTSLPDNVTEIHSEAFRGYTGLALKELPGQITEIGDSAFHGCTGLNWLTISNPIAPALGRNVFPDVPDLVLFVPYGATGYNNGYWAAEKVVYGAALSDLSISSGTLDPSFFPGTNTYSVSVDNSVEQVTLTPTARVLEAITVNGIPVGSGDVSNAITLNAGSNPVDVVAKNSETDSRTYTVNIMRAFPDPVYVTGITLDQSELTLYTDRDPGTASLVAAVQPDNATDKTVTWSSGSPDVAAVDEHGKVTAISPGTAFITVTTTDGGKTAVCAVTVKEEAPVSIPVEGVTLNHASLLLYTNKSPGTASLSAAVQPDNATDKTVNWKSSAPGVASVDGQGNVTAVSPGTASITVTTADGGKTAVCAVTVETGSSSGGSRGGGSSNSSPNYVDRVLTDQKTGVKVTGSQIDKYAAMAVNPGTLHNMGDAGCGLLRSAQAAGRVLCIYDVSLSRVFLGDVTVSIPVEGREGQILTVAHCIDGRLNLCDVTVNEGAAKVTVEKLSPFVVLDGVYSLETLAAPVEKISFHDVKETDWFYQAVLESCQKGLMNGTTADTFDPNGAVTRAQIAAALYRLEGSPSVTAENPFTDIRPGQWYAQGVVWTVGSGLADGCDAVTYAPWDSLTREQLAVILYRYAQYKKWDVSHLDSLAAYTDAKEVSEWAQEAVKWAVGAGFLKGSAGNLTPKGSVSRAEFARILQQLQG